MLSRSCLDLLNLVSVDDYRALSRIPKDTESPGVVSNFEVHDDSDFGAASDNVVSFVLQTHRVLELVHMPPLSFRHSTAITRKQDLRTEGAYRSASFETPTNTLSQNGHGAHLV
ncbi:hypothetical protein K1719_039485 [Acacia pycnantha]|nr:hypothetical protein K1719_039485 [Acacia pycnantha]